MVKKFAKEQLSFGHRFFMSNEYKCISLWKSSSDCSVWWL